MPGRRTIHIPHFPQAPRLGDTSRTGRPLANELFTAIDSFRRHLQRFPQCRPLIPYLEPRSEQGLSLEEELERLQSEAANDAVRTTQLLAVRCYLRSLISDCQVEWTRQITGGVSNYLTLWDQIRRDTPVLAVTFNYDTLLENALANFGIVFNNISDYVAAPALCRVIKPHGSINWENMVETNSIPGPEEFNEAELISRAATFSVTEVYRLWQSETLSRDGPGRAWWPALAIPTVSKSSFACPGEHLDAFRESAGRVSRILLVGWRAAERHFLKELAEAVPKEVRILSHVRTKKPQTNRLTG